MIQEDIRKEMINAMKEKNTVAKEAYSLLLANMKNRAIEQHKEILDDADSIAVIRKLVKSLTEECEAFEKAGRAERASDLSYQIELLQGFLPQMLTLDKIREIIESLSDKSMKAIMIHFKTNYAGKVDMGDVSKVAKEFQ